MTDERIYFSPNLIPAIDKMPFNQDKRVYPIDIPFHEGRQNLINIKLPDGYTLEEAPEQLIAVLKDSHGKFTQNTTLSEGGIVRHVSRYDLHGSIIETAEYDNLKTFMGMVIEKQQEIMVLVQNSDGLEVKE